MKKQIVIIGIILILVCVGLSGCGDDEPSIDPLLQQEHGRFTGTWDTDIADSKIWEFYDDDLHLGMQSSDGTMHDGYYRLKDALIYIFSPEVSYFYEFSVNDMVLTLSVDGNSLGHPAFIVLTRVETAPGNAIFEIINKETSDNFATVSEGGYTGTVWVNVTIKNTGAAGFGSLQVKVFQGTGDYIDCGKDYSSVLTQTAYLQMNDTTTLHFIFAGVENHDNSGCYGVNYQVY